MDWCPKCRCEVPGNMVTIDDIHEWCGYVVLDYDPTAEATRLRAAVEHLRTEWMASPERGLDAIPALLESVLGEEET